MWSEAFFICSRGAYTIVLPGEAENTTFAIGRREQKWHFRPARQKTNFFTGHEAQSTVSGTKPHSKSNTKIFNSYILIWLNMYFENPEICILLLQVLRTVLKKHEKKNYSLEYFRCDIVVFMPRYMEKSIFRARSRKTT